MSPLMADLLQAQFPRARLCLATTTEGAWRRSPFHLVHAGKGITLFAEQDKTAIDELLNTQLAAETRPNINAVLWEKLCINSVINPLCVMHRCKNGELLNIPEAQTQITQLLKELVSISEAASYPTIANNLATRVIEVIEKTANNQCSMWQDVQNKRPTEIDAICGYALTHAEKFGIECPSIEQAYQFIQDVEATY
jgi:2-dehydropantoate 2-reductase